MMQKREQCKDGAGSLENTSQKVECRFELVCHSSFPDGKPSPIYERKQKCFKQIQFNQREKKPILIITTYNDTTNKITYLCMCACIYMCVQLFVFNTSICLCFSQFIVHDSNLSKYSKCAGHRSLTLAYPTQISQPMLLF